MKEQPYLASEDSALLRDALGRYSGENCLEIGAGNAGNLVELARRFRVVVGTDVVRPSMVDWKGRNVNFVMADGSSCLKESSFDLVAFNPPYLREGGAGDLVVEGGQALEVPKKFLVSALRVVKQGGRVVMLLNGDAEVEEFAHECALRGFQLRRLTTKHLFFERLAVYEAMASGTA